VPARRHHLTPHVVGVLLPDPDDREASGQAALAPQHQQRRTEPVAPLGVGVVVRDVVGERGPVVVEPGPQRARPAVRGDVVLDRLVDRGAVDRPAFDEPPQVLLDAITDE
jgi:hypothetical protein